jgi:hypothetical protein
MRHQRQRAYEWNGVKKKEQIGDERNLAFLVQAKLGVNQHEDSREPKSAAQREEHPESILPPVGRRRIPQQTRIGEQRNYTREEITEAGDGRVARGQQHDCHVTADKKHPRASYQ